MDYRIRFKNLRIDNDLTQADVAKLCAVTDKTVSHWETLRHDMPLDCIRKLCIYYRIPSDYILNIPKFN